MSRLQALGGLRGDVDHLVELERALGDFVLDGLSLDEGHDEEGLSLGLVDFMDGANIGVVESRRGLRFAQEACLGFGVFNGFGAEKLQRNGAVEFRIEGLVDDPHAALAEFFGDLVVRDGLADHDGPILPFFPICSPRHCIKSRSRTQAGSRKIRRAARGEIIFGRKCAPFFRVIGISPRDAGLAQDLGDDAGGELVG